VQIAPPGGTNVVTGTVAFLEQLGDSSYVYVRLTHGELVTVRESGHASASIGDPIHLYFPPHCIHLFDSSDVAAKRTAGQSLLSQPVLAGAPTFHAAMAA
jgi:multiple sugar transport system ATP-binding protein